MKVYIGPYLKWIGPYQLARYFPKFMRQHIEESKLLYKICNYIYEITKRKTIVRIDSYDTWNVDYTLSLIIVPMIKQLKETSHSYAEVEEKDLPESIEPCSLDAWNWALDMMIEAFESDINKDWEKEFTSGEMDYKIADSGEIVEGPNHTYKLDREGFEKKAAKIKRGRELFAKYYNNLWD